MESIKILNQNIYRTFFRYVSLNILSMFGLSLYVLADTYFVANGVGPDGLVALNLALPAYSLVNGVGLMIGIGAATLFSIATGKGDKLAGNRIFTQAFLLACVCGLILMATGLIFNRQIAIFLGAKDAHMIEMTATYLKMLMGFSCAFILNNLLVAFVRNDGDPKLAMTGMLAGCLFNIVFDYIFVFPMQLGIFGAALATGIAPILSMIILSTHFLRKRSHFRLIKTKVKSHELRSTLFTGIPSFITEFSSGVIIFLFNMVIMGIAGDIGVAAYGIVANLALVCIAIFTGIGQGVQPVISVNFGAGKIGNVKKTYLLGAGIAFLFGVAFYLIALLIPEQIAFIFNQEQNAELSALTSNGLSLYFIGFLFAGINIVTTSLFASTAHSKPSFLISALRGFVLIIPLVLLLPQAVGINGVWLSSPLTEGFTLLCAIICVLVFFRRLKRHSKKLTV